jgi:hypothetical protein
MSVVAFRAQAPTTQPESAKEPIQVALLQSQIQLLSKQRDDALAALAQLRSGQAGKSAAESVARADTSKDSELAAAKAARESAERRAHVLEQEIKTMQTRERSRDIEHTNELAAIQRKLDEADRKGKRR